jgi:formyl-CoA transferase
MNELDAPVVAGTEPALQGIRVLDLTHQVAGPSATLALAFMGAEVVKVVPPGNRESFDATPFYLNNASKESVALDLKSEEGHATLLRLAAHADVVVENFGPGVVERLNLTYEVFREINPRLVYAQIKGFAPGSPYAEFPCFDPIAQAFSGGSSITGEPDGLPMKPGPDVGDTGTGMVMTSGILAALIQRGRTGRGQHVQLAMSDQVATFLRIHYGWPVDRNTATPRFGNAPPFSTSTAPSGLFACAPFGPNDYVHVHCGNDKQWAKLARAIGREDLLEDARFATVADRGEHKDEVDAAVTAWTSQRDKLEAMIALGSAGVPAGAVRTTTDILADEDLRARGIFVPVPHPVHGEVVIPAWPVLMSDSPVRVEAPHQPGADTADVLQRWLGEQDETVAAREPVSGHA